MHRFFVGIAALFASVVVALAQGTITRTQFPHAASLSELRGFIALGAFADGNPVFLEEAGRQGIFQWESSDLSATLVTGSAASSAVDSTTETILSAGHPLLTGQAVVPTASVNGLTAGTAYYAISGRVDRDDGTAIGDMTANGGLVNSFDGTTSQGAGAVSAKTGTPATAYIGRTLAQPTSVSHVILYGANNQGFVITTDPQVTANLYCGTGSAPSTSDDGTLIGSLTFQDTANESTGRLIESKDPESLCDHIWVELVPASGGTVYSAELVIVEGNDKNYFQLATTHANAMAGTAINLTGTDAVTVERLLDPQQGIYVTVTDDLAGEGGAFVRQFTGPLEAAWFGSDTTALQGALDAISAGGGVLHISGVWSDLSGRLSVAGGPVTIAGDGPAKSVLSWASGAPSSGLRIDAEDDDYHVQVTGLQFLTAQAATQARAATALRLNFSAQQDAGVVQNRINPRALVSNIDMKGSGAAGTTGWLYGLWITDGVHFVASDISFYGHGAGVASLRSKYGIYLNGIGNSVEAFLHNIWAFFSQVGIYSDDVEGVTVSGINLVAVGQGVVASAVTGKPHFNVWDGHINAYGGNVSLTRISQSWVRGLLLYKRSSGAAHSVAVTINDGDQNIVEGNTFVDTDGTFDFDAIELQGGAANTLIGDNLLQSVRNGIIITSASNAHINHQHAVSVSGVLLQGADATTSVEPLGGHQTIATDADFTLTPLLSPESILHTGTLTAARAVTLSTTNVFPGAHFRITRTGSGGDPLNVGTGPLVALATDEWAEVAYDGSAWYLAASGVL